MSKSVKILFVTLLGVALLAVRMYEDILFYDPLLYFFRSDYATQPLPEIETFKLVLNILFRFILNSIFSLGIIYVLFQKNELVKFASVLYALFFVIFLLLFLLFLNTSEGNSYMMLFYIRRFLIQPVLLLLLVPAFYFQLKKK